MKNNRFARPLAVGILGLMSMVFLGVQSSGGFAPAAPTRRVVESPPSQTAGAPPGGWLYETGVQLYAQGRLAEAGRVFRMILKRNPRDVPARLAVDRVEAELIQGARNGTRRTR